MKQIRYALLAGTMLPMVAIPQPGWAEGAPAARPAERAIILAEAVVDPNDPKNKNKGVLPKVAPKGTSTTNTSTTTTTTNTGSQGTSNTNTGSQGTSNTNTGSQGTNKRSFGQPSGNTNSNTNQQKVIQQTNTQQNNQQTNTGTQGTQQTNTGTQGTQQTNTGTQGNQQTNTGTQGNQQTNTNTGTRGNKRTFGTGTGSTTTTTTSTTSTTTTRGTQGSQGVQGTQGNTTNQRVINAPTSTTTNNNKNLPTTNTMTNVNQLHSVRVVKQDPSGRVTIQEPGRLIVQEKGQTFVVRDDMQRFRLGGTNFKTERRGKETFAFISRPGGYRIVNVTGPDGRLIRRSRIGPDGRETVIFRNVLVGGVVATGIVLALAAPTILIPRHHYVVDVANAEPALLYETLDAPPVATLERAYSLNEIRYNVNLRAYVRSLDLNSITFDTGSWQITPEQYPKLEAVANVIKRILSHNPNAVIMIEGHTDLVGDKIDNLALSDERANAVAVVLTDAFQIPPENLVTQGYGEQFPKINDPGPVRENRRVTIRNITHLLAGS